MGLNCNEKKLLDKYNLSLSCLDYSYIKSTTNVKEIENILRVLRSEEEGIYPDLVKFCENRLQELSPNSKLLQVIEQVKSLGELPSAEQVSLHTELKTWIDEIKAKDEDLKKSKKVFGENCDYPIRNMAEIKEKMEKEKESVKTNSFKPRSYDEWNKFDVDKEIKQIENKIMGGIIQKQSDREMNLKEPPLPFVDTTGLSESEKQALAEVEKTKGNEYFKAKDYMNSILYYGRSMSAYPTAAAVCNRAMSHIKLQNYDLAILDCESALHLDPHYVKALYRRGLSYKEMGKMQLAYMDFENALKLDPACKEAKVQLKELSMCPIMTSESMKKSPIIEEISSSNATANTAQENDSKLHSLEQSSPKEQIIKKMSENSSHKSVGNSSIVEHSSSSAVDASSPDKKRKSSLDSEIEAKTTKYYTKVKTAENEFRTSTENFPTNKLNSTSEQKQIPLHSVQENSTINRLTENSIVDEKENPYLNKSNDTSHIIEKMLGKKITAKTDILQSNSEKTLDLQSEKMTPFKFLSLWHSSNAYKDSKAGADILNRILPSELPSLVSNKLDGDLLNGLILAIKEFTTSGEWFKGYEFLRNIINIPRIKTISLFLSSSQRNDIDELLRIIEENQRMEITKLKDVMLGKR